MRGKKMNRRKKDKSHRDRVNIQYVEQFPGEPSKGVVTEQGFIGWAPSGPNADLIADLLCQPCGRPVVLAWYVLDEIDETAEEPTAVPFTFSCENSGCYPYRKRHRYAKFE
jgi:hypothetical protein